MRTAMAGYASSRAQAVRVVTVISVPQELVGTVNASNATLRTRYHRPSTVGPMRPLASLLVDVIFVTLVGSICSALKAGWAQHAHLMANADAPPTATAQTQEPCVVMFLTILVDADQLGLSVLQVSYALIPVARRPACKMPACLAQAMISASAGPVIHRRGFAGEIESVIPA